MTNKIAFFLASLACIATASTAASAATPAIATTNVNLRAGPSTHFPVVKVVPAGARLVTFGCVKGYTWCDVSFAGNRGWLAARYVRLAGRGVIVSPKVAVWTGIPVVAFNHAYWRAHYVGRPWVGRWPVYAARWRAPAAVRARAPRVRAGARRAVRARCLRFGC